MGAFSLIKCVQGFLIKPKPQNKSADTVTLYCSVMSISHGDGVALFIAKAS